VIFQVEDKGSRFDLSVPKFLYNARQGGSGALEGTAKISHNSLAVGLVSDGDELVERYTGLTARYENTRLGSDRVHLQFEFDSFHEQWNRATLARFAPAPAGAPEAATALYRTRQNFEPAVTFVIAEPLTLTVGASFERFESQYPGPRIEAANTAIASLRFHEQFEESDYVQNVEAVYNLRAATRTLGSDFEYTRHRWGFRYRMNHGKHVVTDDVSAGVLSGNAPLFDRYVLGNSSTLRGWNKFDLDPLGGNRMVHNSVDYRYGWFEVFYDVGAIWDSGVEPATARHGIGVGLRQGAFSLAVAFPIRQGRADPIFMMGMNY
jgi:outer membrane protein assembly factor BamA